MFDSVQTEIAEMFDALGGCASHKQLLAVRGMSVLRPERSGTKTPLQIRQYNARPDVKERKRVYARERMRQPDVMERKKRDARRRTLQDLIAKWETDAKLICIGREVSPAEWLDVMKSPQNEEERAARTDFIYFLRICRKSGVSRIAAMLETSDDVVIQALASRGVTAK